MVRSSQRLALVAAFAAASLLVATGAYAQARHDKKMGAASQPAAAVVKVVDNKFEPATVTIKSGQAVEWQNNGVTGHSVTDDPSKAKDKADSVLPNGAKPFDSGSLKHGANFHHTFMVPGTYKYFCMGHEAKGMLGTVVVEPATGGAAGPHGGTSPGHRSTGGHGGTGY